jgi:hypothetical protein
MRPFHFFLGDRYLRKPRQTLVGNGRIPQAHAQYSAVRTLWSRIARIVTNFRFQFVKFVSLVTNAE